MARGAIRRQEPGTGRSALEDLIWVMIPQNRAMMLQTELNWLTLLLAFRSYEQQRKLLIQRIEESAWDRRWYLQAFFDDGTPLGSSASQEAKIDSLPQSWACLSGAAKARLRLLNPIERARFRGSLARTR